MATAEATLTAFVPQVLGRRDYEIIGEIVEDGSRVLDLGCGEGDLLAWLVERKQVQARGVELSPAKVRRCVAQGLSVYQGDIDQGLADYPDNCFDYVILSQTMQETHQPVEVLREMTRVGRKVIVAFPNFGYWRVRLSLLFRGRAPKTSHLPYEWYNSPNIHVVTLLDFEELMKRDGMTIERSYFLTGDRRIGALTNLRAETAIYQIRR
jgi:methionine biosynthesis protein MetW